MFHVIIFDLFPNPNQVLVFPKPNHTLPTAVRGYLFDTAVDRWVRKHWSSCPVGVLWAGLISCLVGNHFEELTTNSWPDGNHFLMKKKGQQQKNV